MSLAGLSRSLASHTTSLASSCAIRRGRSIVAAPSGRPCAAPRRPMGQALRPMASSSAGGDLVAQINAKNSENSVMVYSKTYCPYCSEVKSLFSKLGVSAKVVELDELADGDSLQQALASICGRRTVPQVFIGGKHVGGCDDTVAAMNSGKLKELLAAAGVQAKL